MNKKKQRKGNSVWLVTWEWVGDYAKPGNIIAAILNPRWSAERVREYVEFIYVLSQYTVSEQVGYAKNRSFNPYPAKFNQIRGIPWQGQIICGHNPYLFARLVDKLTVTDDSNEEKVIWAKRAVPNFNKYLQQYEEEL